MANPAEGPTGSMTGGGVIPPPYNEPVLDYAPGTPARAELQAALKAAAGDPPEIPCVIGGREVRTGRLQTIVAPHAHGQTVATFHAAGPQEVVQAIYAARTAWRDWQALPLATRAAVFLKAAALLSGPWRARLNATTMLGQGKTCREAEIDAACELIDFFRWNPAFAARLEAEQPVSPAGVRNHVELRALEGYVVAMTPFNFTAIGGNLPTAPALMGNVVLWKPSESQTLSAWHTYKLLEAAGLPPGVINFLPGDGATLAPALLGHPEFAGLHFTGSSAVFRRLWQQASENLAGLRGYPRMVGETGGKDFVLAHPSADIEALQTAIVRGGFEYQGQKCSAVSRVYVPRSIWARLRSSLADTVSALPMGDVTDFRNFMGAVIKRPAWERHRDVLARVRQAASVSMLAGGGTDDAVGFFVQPTVLVTGDPRSETMVEELFGPIVTVFVYEDARWDEVLDLVNDTSPYALTGAVFASERGVVEEASVRLRHAAGNFYINDKPTGAVVGQQPFGGGRASGTNDKAGSGVNLLRWVSARAVKETFVSPRDWRYPYMG